MNSIELENVESDKKYHEVTGDESLRSIAVNIGNITVSQLAKYNGISCDAFLYKGQRIYIPSLEDLEKNFVLKKKTSYQASSKKISTSSMISDFDTNYPMPLTVDQEVAEDVFEKKLLKTESRYININSGWYIDGILILTEEYFCFDSSNEFFNFKNNVLKMQNFSYPFNIKFLIGSVTSFNTHKTLSNLVAKNSKLLTVDESCKIFDQSEFESTNDVQVRNNSIYVAIQAKETVDNTVSPKPLENMEKNVLINFSGNNFFIFKIDISKLNHLCSIMLKARSTDGDNLLQEPDLTKVTYEQRPPECTLINGTSEILTETMLEDLAKNLPVHWFGHSLKIIYNSERDGYSIATMYRKSRDCENAVILLIKDTGGKVFGSIMSETMRISSYFYGTGETCVFHWDPEFKVYSWSKDNTFFMRGSSDYFMIGCEDCFNAIWFDQALKNGRSDKTSTFNNPSLCSVYKEGEKSFIIDKIELWELVI